MNEFLILALFNEFNFQKYLGYAFLEIILIVFGILIVLQLNRWNERRKLKKIEKESLEQMRQNLLDEIKEFERSNDNGNKIKEYLLGILDGGNENVDWESFPKRLLTKFYWHPKFDTGYLGLKAANNLSLISNENLRNSLVQFYGDHYDWLDTLAIEHRHFVTTLIDKFILENLPVDLQGLTDKDVLIDLLKRTNFNSVLSHQVFYMDEFRRIHDESIIKAKSIISSIDDYLS